MTMHDEITVEAGFRTASRNRCDDSAARSAWWRAPLLRWMLLIAAALPLCSGADVYQRVVEALHPQPHRTPGSEEYGVAIAAIEAVLREHGLEPHHQTYNTVVPVTTTCVVTVDGQSVPAHPYFVTGVGLMPTTHGRVLTGPAIYAGAGQRGDFDGLDIAGSIVVLELGSPGMEDAMRLGAQAIVLVDNDDASQWDLARHRPIPGTPVVWMDRDVADRHGLLQGTTNEIALELAMSWEDREGVNLWVEIPGDGTTFSLGSSENMVLSANLSTNGVVPDYAPESRQVANIAVLVETLVALAQSDSQRGVIGVLWGSHMAAQEGARHFFRVVDQVERTPAFFRNQADFYRSLIADAERVLGFMGRPEFIAETGHRDYNETSQRLREKINRRMSELNYQLGLVYRAIRRLEQEQQRVEMGALAEIREGWQEQYDALDIERAALTELKSRWNDMNRQLAHRSIREEDRDIYEEMVGLVRTDLDRQRDQAATLLRHNDSARRLAAVFTGTQMVGHYHFDFASSQRQWLFNLLGDRRIHGTQQQIIRSFSRHVEEMRSLYASIAEDDWAPATLNEEACELRRNPDSLCYPGLRSLACTAAHAVARYGYNLTNIGEPLNDDAMPRRRAVDLRRLVPQMSSFFVALADAPGISVPFRGQRTRFSTPLVFRAGAFGQPAGLLVQRLAKGGSDLEGPAADALVTAGTTNTIPRQWITGHLRGSLTRTNVMGMVTDPNLDAQIVQTSVMALKHDEHGHLAYRTGEPSATRLNVRFGVGGAFAAQFFPKDYDFVTNPDFLMASTDAPFVERTDAGFLSSEGGWVHMARDDSRWKVVGPLLLLGSRIEQPDLRHEPTLFHRGYTNEPTALLNLDLIRQSSNDYGLLNEHRLQVLRGRNIINDAAEVLSATAQEFRDDADQQRADREWSRAEAKDIFALTHDQRAYEPTRQIANDMVTAVVILMLLCIPFAFSMERLVVGATSIYRQILFFGLIFLITFQVLYWLHPAFTLAAAPVVIFLAFVIIMLSGTVIYVVMSRFKMELMSLQGLASKSHSEEGKTGTALASIFIGISGMRNRPLKTALTATTIVLLTFTILVFASFESAVGVVETYIGQGTGSDRIELYRSSYLPIPPKLLDAIEDEIDDNFEVYRRSGYFRDPTTEEASNLDLSLFVPRNGAIGSIKGVLGIDPQESRDNENLQAIVPQWGSDPVRADDRPIWLAEVVARDLQLEVGDIVTIRGIAFTYRGPFELGTLSSQMYLSGGRMVPPDFEAIMRQNELQASDNASAAEAIERIDTSSFQWCPGSDVAIVQVSDLAIFGRTRDLVNAAMIYPRGDANVYETAELISRVFHDSVFAKGAEGARSYFFTEAFEGSGFGDIIVPLLLGGLIIFSSLLGSIVDREREIFTFSALGLSPPNVAALFFAESSVYAVIGGVGGYLVSQIVAAFLNFLAGYGLFQPPEMNFSSLSSTYTILVVMATVILSTIYPALKAGKSANPGVARKWKMPQPSADNRLTFLFPFTVSSTDMAGILSFIHEHFDNHRDASLGSFAARQVVVRRLPDDPVKGRDNFAIEAEVSLAPFDLGIFQLFHMSSRDSDIVGIKEVVVEITLLSGSPNAWIRAIRSFIADLRKQFLLWRSLPAETVEYYCSQTTQEGTDAGGGAQAEHASANDPTAS